MFQQGSNDGLETYFWKVSVSGEIWEGLGLVSYWKLEVSVSGIRVSFYKQKIQFTAQLKTLVTVNFSCLTVDD